MNFLYGEAGRPELRVIACNARYIVVKRDYEENTQFLYYANKKNYKLIRTQNYFNIIAENDSIFRRNKLYIAAEGKSAVADIKKNYFAPFMIPKVQFKVSMIKLTRDYVIIFSNFLKEPSKLEIFSFFRNKVVSTLVLDKVKNLEIGAYELKKLIQTNEFLLAGTSIHFFRLITNEAGSIGLKHYFHMKCKYEVLSIAPSNTDEDILYAIFKQRSGLSIIQNKEEIVNLGLEEMDS